MGSSRASGRRRLLPFALAAAGAVAVLAVIGLTGADGGWLAGLVRSAPEEATPEEMTAAALAADPTARGPKLLASEAAKPRETHGPVTVSVVDRAGAPVEGVCVLAVVSSPPDAEGKTRQERLEQGTTDAAGRTRFADLPYDGRASVRARARAPGMSADLQPVDSTISPPSGGIVPLVFTWGAGEALETRVIEPGDETIVIRESEPPEGSSESTAPPVFTFTGTPDALSHLIRAGAGDTTALAEAVVTGPEVTLAIDRGIPLEVQVREGGEGRLRADARWQVRPRLAWVDDAYGAATLPLTRGTSAQVTCRVEAPKGFIARREAEWGVFVHPLAQRLVAVYPLRPAVDVLVLLPPEVMPYRAEDWEGSITVAGVTLEQPDLHVDAQGRLRVRGGAHVMGDTVHVSGTLGKGFQVDGRGYIGPDPRQTVLVEVTVTPVSPAPNVKEIVLFETQRGITFSGGEGQFRIELGNVVFNPITPDSLRQLADAQAEAERALAASQAALPIRAVAANGAPATGALLLLGDQTAFADAQGRATFRDVPVGTSTIVMLGAGASTAVMVEVGPAPRSEAVIAARAGGTLEVEVVDTKGRPLPYAHVDVTQDNGQTYMDCVDGVQRLDPYTNEVGRRTYRALAAGTVKVRAAFGTRSAEQDVVLTDGGREVVRIELPVFAPSPPPETEAPAAK